MQKVVVMLAVCWLAFPRAGASAQLGVDNAALVRD
jgi:hypothetical protein